MCREEPIQLGYLYLGCHDDTLETRTHVRSLCAISECLVWYGNGFYIGEVQHEVLEALDSEEEGGGVVEVPNVSLT